MQKEIKGKRRDEKERKKEKRRIDAKTAVRLSLFPGAGYAYIGNIAKSAEIIFFYLLLLWILLSPDHYAQPPPAFMLFIIWLVLTAIFWFFTIPDVRKRVEKRT